MKFIKVTITNFLVTYTKLLFQLQKFSSFVCQESGCLSHLWTYGGSSVLLNQIPAQQQQLWLTHRDSGGTSLTNLCISITIVVEGVLTLFRKKKNSPS